MRRKILMAVLMTAMTATSGFGGTVDQAVAAELRKQGYTAVKVTTTWLGRVIITARLNGGHREIVINPKTGEILRDYSSGALQMAAESGEDGAVSSATEGTAGAVVAAGDARDGAIEVLPKEVVTTKEQR